MKRPQDLMEAYQTNVMTLKAIAALFVGRAEFSLSTALEQLTLASLVRAGLVKVLDEDHDWEIVWAN